MSAAGGEIRVVMTLDDRDFTVKTTKVGRTIKEFKADLESTHSATKRFESGLGSMGTKFKDIVFAISILRFAFKDLHDIVLGIPIAFIKAGGEMERMTMLMQGLSKETDEMKKRAEALKDVQFIFNFAKDTPFELKALTDTFVKLKTAGLDPARGSMAALTNSVAKFGGSDELLKRASIAVQQMAGKGVISMEELRQQLGEAVPNAIQLMARGMGMTMGELTKAISKGTVEARSALDKMFVQMESDAAGASKRMMTTLPGLFSQLKTEWELFKIEAAGGSGVMDVVKVQVKLLTDFFRSPEGKQFAKDTGEAIRFLIESIIALKDILVASIPAIKVFGGAWLAYFGGQTIVNGIKNITEAIKLQKSETLAAARAPLELAKAQLEAQRVKKQFDLDVASKTYSNDLAAFEKGHELKVKAAAAELEAVKKVGAQQIANANLATSRAGVLYAEAVKYERAINELDASGKARQGVKRQNFVDNMNAFREETTALQARAVAQRNEATASIAAAERRVEALAATTGAERQAAFATSAHGKALQENIAHQRRYVAEINGMITAKEKLIAKAGGAISILGGIGRTLVSGLGYMALFTAAIYAITWAYDKLTGSARRATEEMLRNERIKNKQSTEDDVKGKRADIEAQIKKVDELRVKLGTPKAGTPDPNGRIGRLTAELNAETAKLNEMVVQLDSAKADVARTTAQSKGAEAVSTYQSIVTEQLAQSKAQAAMLASGVAVTDANKANNEAAMKAANAEHLKVTKAYLEEKLRITRSVYAERLPAAKALGKAAEAELTNAFISDAKQIQELIDTNGKNNLIATKGGGDAARARAADARESPLLKMVQEQKADFAKAKIGLEDLGDNVLDFANSAERKAVVTLLEDLAKGKFDISATNKEKTNGIQPAKNVRDDLIEKFSNWDGSAKDFIGTIGGLDLKLRSSEKTVREYFQEYVGGAGELATSQAQIKGMTDVMQRQAGIAAELALANAEYAAGVSYLPEPIIALERELARLSSRLGLSGEALKEFNAARNDMVGSRLEIDLLNRSSTAIRTNEQARIDLITNTQERAQAQYELSVDLLEREYVATKEVIEKTAKTREEADKRLRLLEEDRTARRAKIDTKYFNDSKSAVDKLVDVWADYGDAVDRVLASQSQKWLDAVVDFVSGAKVSFKDLVTSILKDFLRIQMQAALFPAMKAGTDYLGGLAKGLIGGASAAIGGPGNLLPYGEGIAFADGGIMSKFGSMPLNKYMNGGIADSPQLAVFGEGRLNEAYVPLPDGRSIPVTMSGGGGVGNVVVNVINQTSQPVTASQTQPRFDGKQMIIDVVMTEANRPGPFRDSMRNMVKA